MNGLAQYVKSYTKLLNIHTQSMFIADGVETYFTQMYQNMRWKADNHTTTNSFTTSRTAYKLSGFHLWAVWYGRDGVRPVQRICGLRYFQIYWILGGFGLDLHNRLWYNSIMRIAYLTILVYLALLFTGYNERM